MRSDGKIWVRDPGAVIDQSVSLLVADTKSTGIGQSVSGVPKCSAPFIDMS